MPQYYHLVMVKTIPSGVLPFGNQMGHFLPMTDKPISSADAVANRRKQLQRWIDEHFNGVKAAFIASTNDGVKQLNQGELSGLLKTKSFGEKRAETLEALAHMPRGYLDQRPITSSANQLHSAQEPQSDAKVVTTLSIRWPFKSVSYQRLVSLEKKLGKSQYSAALVDMDAHLDILVAKLEHKVIHDKRRSAQ